MPSFAQVTRLSPSHQSPLALPVQKFVASAHSSFTPIGMGLQPFGHAVVCVTTPSLHWTRLLALHYSPFILPSHSGSVVLAH